MNPVGEEVIKSVAYIEVLMEQIDQKRKKIREVKKEAYAYRVEIEGLQARILREMVEKRDVGVTSYQVMKRIRPRFKHKFIWIYRKKYE